MSFRTDRNKLVCLPAATVATTATAVLSFDTKGHERLNVRINGGTSATTSAVFTVLKFSESDTITSAGSMTDIVALTGGTETSTSVGFVLPGEAGATNALENGGIVEFQIDLRKRKRYLGMSVTPAQSWVFSATGDTLADESGDTTTEKLITNLANTNAASVVQIIADV